MFNAVPSFLLHLWVSSLLSNTKFSAGNVAESGSCRSCMPLPMCFSSDKRKEKQDHVNGVEIWGGVFLLSLSKHSRACSWFCSGQACCSNAAEVPPASSYNPQARPNGQSGTQAHSAQRTRSTRQQSCECKMQEYGNSKRQIFSWLGIKSIHFATQ